MPAEQAKGGVNCVTICRHRPIEPERRRVCACVRACDHERARSSVRVPVRARARACACVCVCACACVRACASACWRDVFAMYDNNISPRQIMIQIKIIILYVIQIRHTDHLPLNGYPASSVY